MRAWLVEDKKREPAASVEALLRQLEERPGTDFRLLGASPFQPDFADAMRKLVPDLLDLVVINEPVWPEECKTQDVLNLGLGMVVVTPAENVGRLRSLADLYPVAFVPPQASVDALWLALVGAYAAQRRQAQWKGQVARLQQRLSDRILIERAKGILVQRLKISEEDAYKRLRVLSRRQRRQIRDIAQSLLDTQFLFAPEANGFAGHVDAEPEPKTEVQPPPAP